MALANNSTEGNKGSNFNWQKRLLQIEAESKDLLKIIAGVSPPTTVETPGITSDNAPGTIAAGFKSISILNSGGADGVIGGVTVGNGITVSWQASDEATLDTIGYDATGTTFIIITTV